MNSPIYVTRPFLPPLEQYTQFLEGVWERGILTHNGPLVQRLEQELIQFLDVPNMVAMTNGTVALQLAIRALDLQGEILTTPFSWIATCSSIIWEYCQPVFVDIDPATFNMDPEKIEASITSRSVGIMPVHTFGNPCDVHGIAEVAARHNLKVVYDGAHALGTRVDDLSVFHFGDITATSFHATKLFQTAEGGGCTAPNPEVAERLRRLRFFGHNAEKEVVDCGCNGKMTEVHAALGLAIMPYLTQILESRRHIATLYHQLLKQNPTLQFQEIRHGETNYSYFPVVFDCQATLLRVVEALQDESIYPRRYFHPSLNQIELLQGQICPNSQKIADRILCLPSYYDLSDESITRISEIVLTACEKTPVG